MTNTNDEAITDTNVPGAQLADNPQQPEVSSWPATLQARHWWRALGALGHTHVQACRAGASIAALQMTHALRQAADNSSPQGPLLASDTGTTRPCPVNATGAAVPWLLASVTTPVDPTWLAQAVAACDRHADGTGDGCNTGEGVAAGLRRAALEAVANASWYPRWECQEEGHQPRWEGQRDGHPTQSEASTREDPTWCAGREGGPLQSTGQGDGHTKQGGQGGRHSESHGRQEGHCSRQEGHCRRQEGHCRDEELFHGPGVVERDGVVEPERDVSASCPFHVGHRPHHSHCMERSTCNGGTNMAIPVDGRTGAGTAGRVTVASCPLDCPSRRQQEQAGDTVGALAARVVRENAEEDAEEEEEDRCVCTSLPASARAALWRLRPRLLWDQLSRLAQQVVQMPGDAGVSDYDDDDDDDEKAGGVDDSRTPCEAVGYDETRGFKSKQLAGWNRVPIFSCGYAHSPHPSCGIPPVIDGLPCSTGMQKVLAKDVMRAERVGEDADMPAVLPALAPPSSWAVRASVRRLLRSRAPWVSMVEVFALHPDMLAHARSLLCLWADRGDEPRLCALASELMLATLECGRQPRRAESEQWEPLRPREEKSRGQPWEMGAGPGEKGREGGLRMETGEGGGGRESEEKGGRERGEGREGRYGRESEEKGRRQGEDHRVGRDGAAMGQLPLVKTGVGPGGMPTLEGLHGRPSAEPSASAHDEADAGGVPRCAPMGGGPPSSDGAGSRWMSRGEGRRHGGRCSRCKGKHRKKREARACSTMGSADEGISNAKRARTSAANDIRVLKERHPVLLTEWGTRLAAAAAASSSSSFLGASESSRAAVGMPHVSTVVRQGCDDVTMGAHHGRDDVSMGARHGGENDVIVDAARVGGAGAYGPLFARNEPGVGGVGGCADGVPGGAGAAAHRQRVLVWCYPAYLWPLLDALAQVRDGLRANSAWPAAWKVTHLRDRLLQALARASKQPQGRPASRDRHRVRDHLIKEEEMGREQEMGREEERRDVEELGAQTADVELDGPIKEGKDEEGKDEEGKDEEGEKEDGGDRKRGVEVEGDELASASVPIAGMVTEGICHTIAGERHRVNRCYAGAAHHTWCVCAEGAGVHAGSMWPEGTELVLPREERGGAEAAQGGDRPGDSEGFCCAGQEHVRGLEVEAEKEEERNDEKGDAAEVYRLAGLGKMARIARLIAADFPDLASLALNFLAGNLDSAPDGTRMTCRGDGEGEGVDVCMTYSPHLKGHAHAR
eukprot:jgi/Mesvir1/20490/Mv12377-RA.1